MNYYKVIQRDRPTKVYTKILQCVECDFENTGIWEVNQHYKRTHLPPPIQEGDFYYIRNEIEAEILIGPYKRWQGPGWYGKLVNIGVDGDSDWEWQELSNHVRRWEELKTEADDQLSKLWKLADRNMINDAS